MTEENTSRLIKKYKNRRLYDLVLSQYITLEELRNYVLDGIEFQVVDASSGKDLTNVTLMQLFVELESHSTQFLSAAMLRQLIILSQHSMSQNYKALLEQMLSGMPQQLHPVVADVQQKATELWTKQSEQLLKSWQDFFKE